jgi:integrase
MVLLPSPQPGTLTSDSFWGWAMKGTYQEYRKGHYRVRFYWKGKRYFVYTFHDSPLLHPKMCEQLLDHINFLIAKAKKEKTEFDPLEFTNRKEKPFLFKNAIEVWIKLSTCSMETLEPRERIASKFFIPYFGERDIREIRKIDIDSFYSHLKELCTCGHKKEHHKVKRCQFCRCKAFRGYKDKYLYNILGELKACFRFHSESIPKFPSFPKISFQKPPIRWILEEHQNQIFEFIPEGDKPVFIFQRYTACRPNEARGLLKENIHREQGYFVLATVLNSSGSLKTNTKTRRAKPLPIVPEIDDALKPRDASKFQFTRNGDPYSKRTHETIWKIANRKAHEKYGTPLVPMYSGTKHSFGCQRLNAGFSLDEIRAVMGHTDTKTTERYAEYLTSSLRSVMSGKVVRLEKKKPEEQGGAKGVQDSVTY